MISTLLRHSVTRAALIGAWIGSALLVAIPQTALSQGRPGTNYDVVKLPVAQKVPINLDPSDKITQGIFRPTVKTTSILMSGDGWIGPLGAGVYLGSEDKTVPDGWCNLLVKPAQANKPFVALNLDCRVEKLWYSAVVQSDLHAVMPDGQKTDFAVAGVTDGGFRILRVLSKSMSAPAIWNVNRKVGGTNKTIDIGGLGNVALYARPQIPSDQIVLVLTAAQAEALGRHLPAADRAEMQKLLGR